MIISAAVWDKKSPINGRDAEFLSGHFKKQNGNDNRILIAYDGVVNRIEYLDDARFTYSEKEYMNDLMKQGTSKDEAIAQTWGEKIRVEYEKDLANAEKSSAEAEQLRADLVYLSIMTGVDL